jgi:hypothetical protein
MFQRVAHNRLIAPLAAYHLLDVADERPRLAVATEKPGPAVGQWRNKAIAPYALASKNSLRNGTKNLQADIRIELLSVHYE